ncbi:O-antigen/teichoic acid export membrane protein [Gillisia sp. Hel_I_86]|uniref:lipopolysaccharide biosynthesis protein n=1 Tax=Gillisia sp. Hel_I_86 TaxID=1249981 RepID=UPI00119BFA23|nr:lipopolysaccharide biosynthesis protein [Gillisia sp. Hel_I_86]TVZ28225.1 O-antigen/teichoic acid export membrane protein [Gillisia sp. Hel_I_86]
MPNLKSQAVFGLVWTFAQQFGTQLVSFIVSIFLARLLLPEQFGLIGMIAVFIHVGDALLKSGLTQSLIRNTDIEQDDYATVFYYNLGASIILYFVAYFSAPLIANFYEEPVLTPLVQLYCLVFIISAFTAVQQTRMTIEMDFKKQTIISIPSIIIGGITGIVLAINGFGVWSLVWNQLVTAVIRSIQFWIYSDWKPTWEFNVKKFKVHFNFGYKITLSTLIQRIFANLYILVIGKFFSAAQVGFYTRAETMKNLPVTNLTMALEKVTFPLFSKIQNDTEKLKRVYRKVIMMVIFVIAPFMLSLGVLAEPIFRILFTEKWLPAVPYFQILCISGIFYPLHIYNSNVFMVKGRTDIFLRLTIVKQVLLVLGVIVGLQFGVLGLMWSQVVVSIVSFFIIGHYTSKMINYSAWAQILDILPMLGVSIFVAACMYFLDLYINKASDIVRILTGALMSIVFYLGLSYLFNFKTLMDFKDLIPAKKR